ncbi:response regulator [Erysipelothrix sp. HDW6C]|uniref:helix-turn-helix domain-containing protein n=1 Tax=Erysipelothrix sp. HDW6C TaxID=2714930 RepID=UPI0014098999|nr:helix-turn-helix domain-containing protein [Erysipelothrix sp. HDW6C]QIK70657.1 response regulator [Erysipelothrix sp. HDW6C]
MMLKVGIFDDEVLVCRLIHRLIDWEGLELEFVGFEHDGLAAYDKVIHGEVDIVITDIRMPGYDGIELISKIKAIKPNVEFIIVSGYSEFEYTKSAIKFGVSDYILKPVNQEELNETLLGIKDKVLKQESQHIENEAIRSHVSKQRELIQNRMVHDLYYGNRNEVALQFGEYNYLPIIVSADGLIDDCNSALSKMTTTLINNHQTVVFGTNQSENNVLILFMLYSGEDPSTTIRNRYLDAVYILEQHHEVSMSLCVGPITASLPHLEKAIQILKQCVMQRYIAHESVLAFESLQQTSNLDAVYQEYAGQLEDGVRYLDATRISNLMHDLAHDLSIATNLKGYQVHRLFREIVDAMQIAFMQFRDIDSSVLIFGNVKTKMAYKSTYNEQIEVMIQETELLICGIIEQKQHLEVKPIRIAKQYIQDHYQEALSLTQVSEHINLNSSYFSQLFKQEEGKNFTEYLLEVRMNQAKLLIESTQMSIADICVYVGYSDPKHFTKNFKKYTGLKPSEYRKIHA